eukprot:TCONS_00055292-protein
MMVLSKIKRFISIAKDYMDRPKQRDKAIEELQEQFRKQEQKLTEQQDMINKLKTTLLKKCKKIEKLETRIETQENVLKEVTTKIRKKRKKMNKIKNKIEEAGETVEETRDVMHSFIKTEKNWCPYAWCISDFAAKRKNARLRNEEYYVTSEPFFMVSGYKAQAILYPNGYEKSQNKHMSIFIRLLEGPIDEHLRWPLICCIEFGVIHEGELENACQINTNLSQCSEAFRRPSRDSDKSYGFFEFLPLTDLNKYIENDTLVINISAWSINL